MRARPAILFSVLAWLLLGFFAAGGVAAEISSSPEFDLEAARNGRVVASQMYDAPHVPAATVAVHDPTCRPLGLERRIHCRHAHRPLPPRPLTTGRHRGPRAPPVIS